MSQRAFVKGSMVGKMMNKRQNAQKATNSASREAIRAANRNVVSHSNSYVPPVVQATVERAMINEKKKNAHFVDLAVASYALDTTGSLTLVATIAQGASEQQRIGKKALYKSIQFRGGVYAGSATITCDATVILVYDREPTGSLPNITDILNTANSRSFNNDANSDRFKIVRRWEYALIGNTTTPTTGSEMFGFDEYVDLRNLPVQFGNAATGAIGDIKEGALYLVTVSSNGVGTTAGTLTCGSRTRFIDLA